MVESTCLKERCYIYREEGDKCPFFIQTVWKAGDSATTNVLDDCAPRRNTLLLMDYSNRAIGIQQDYEQQRNMYAEVLKGVGGIVKEMSERNKMFQEKLGIEYEDDTKLLFEDEK